MYLAWAAYYEGRTDSAYFDLLISRVLDQILLAEGLRPFVVPETPAVRLGLNSRTVESVATEICDNQSAFHLLFIHADTGGRALENQIPFRREAFAEKAAELCGWDITRTIHFSPRHEMEAWALADSEAVCRSLGFRGRPADLGLPRSAQEAERLQDPKAVLDMAARTVSERRFRSGAASLLTPIAQEQSLESLRALTSFQAFEAELRQALIALGCLMRAG